MKLDAFETEFNVFFEIIKKSFGKDHGGEIKNHLENITEKVERDTILFFSLMNKFIDSTEELNKAYKERILELNSEIEMKDSVIEKLKYLLDRENVYFSEDLGRPRNLSAPAKFS